MVWRPIAGHFNILAMSGHRNVLWRHLREYVTQASVGGAFLVLTGFAPEEWLAHAVHWSRLPEATLHLWHAGIDLRLVPIMFGVAVIVGDLLVRRHGTAQAASPAVAGVAGAGAVAVQNPTGPHALRERSSVAVMPFSNMSGDPEQEYFCDGIVEEIITGLAHLPWLFVIARNSSFTYKGKSVDVRQVGRELGVRYVLEGSIRKAAGRVRITCQLVEAETGAHIWADRFDGELSDVFSLQDQVTDNIVRAIAPTMRHAELDRVRRKPPDNLDAYDLYLRALQNWYSMTRQSTDVALQFLQKGLELDPGYAPALALRGLVIAYADTQGWIQPPGSRHHEVLGLIRQALLHTSNDPEVLAGCAHMLVWCGGEFDEGFRLAERARALAGC